MKKLQCNLHLTTPDLTKYSLKRRNYLTFSITPKDEFKCGYINFTPYFCNKNLQGYI